tara:strand:- start:2819 stop:3541 length:723 start_codon:yes stop_codon:yes gene_type:complete
MDNEFKNKKIFISGGTNGIGYEIAKYFLEKKSKVYVLGRKNKFKNIKNLTVYEYDVLKKEELEKLINKIKKINFGLVVHSLGGSLGVDDHSSLKKTGDVWLLNAAIPILLNEFFLKKMKLKKFGRIVHISSASTVNLDGRSPYICSKSYLNSYIKQMSLKVSKSNILLNGILPGAIIAHKNNLYNFIKKNEKNEKIFVKKYLKVKKIGTLNSMVPVLEFLLSRYNNYMLGELIKIDGGET